MATCPNEGQVTNLPEGVAVETWAMVDRLGVHPVQSGPIPMPLLGLMMSVVAEMETSVEAAVTGDLKKVEQALFASPMLYRKDQAAELARQLVAAHRAHLPQFATAGGGRC
jgi:6-phospho-beta-glucosidase